MTTSFCYEPVFLDAFPLIDIIGNGIPDNVVQTISLL
jgi:hypothetical protein